MAKYKKIHLYYVYITTNLHKTVLYTGVTNNIIRRKQEHKDNDSSSFTGKYKAHYIVYYEEHKYILNAIEREKEIKDFSKAKKILLIESVNPNWDFWLEEEI